MKKILISVLSVAILLFSLVGCRGEALPEGMDEDALFTAGKDVMLLLVDGEYETVHELLREDQREQVSVDDIREVVTSQLDGAGIYKQIEDHMATGYLANGERFGISVLYCEFSEEDVLIRVSFDSEWNLVGFSIKQR